MTAIYEFTCFLRVPAESTEEADHRAHALADAVSHGEATLALDDSEPTVEAADGEPRSDEDEQAEIAYPIPADAEALNQIQGALDGREWNGDTMETVASIVRATGRPVRDVADVPES
ncbi:MAG: hypothetical protein ACTHN3_11295 [Solirubrobacterales bacterium]